VRKAAAGLKEKTPDMTARKLCHLPKRGKAHVAAGGEKSLDTAERREETLPLSKGK